MDHSALITAVFTGNVLTACFVWGLVQFNKYERHADAPWMVFAAVGFPVVFCLLTFVSIEGLPPHFDALAVR
jgi:hypothetical protein